MNHKGLIGKKGLQGLQTSDLDALERLAKRIRREHSQLADSGGAFSVHAADLVAEANALDAAIRTLAVQLAEAS